MKLKNTFCNSLALVPGLLLATSAVADAGTGSGAKAAPPLEDVIMPYYDLLDKLRLVTRYTWAGGDGDRPLALASRYERPAVQDGSSVRGDNYHSIYAGLNYYLCGDKLNLMTGVEWSTLGGAADYNGFTWLGGVRLDF